MKIYNTISKRVIMRFAEIFLVAGFIGLLSSPELQSLLPPIAIGIVAAGLKALREWMDGQGRMMPNGSQI